MQATIGTSLTGAATGMGLTTAELFLRHGWTVVGVDGGRRAAPAPAFSCPPWPTCASAKP